MDTVGRSRDRDWIAEWVAAWGDQVVQFLAAYTGDSALAQDLAQDTFLKVYRWRLRHPARSVNPGLFFRTARNLAKDRWRKEERERRALARAHPMPSGAAPDTAILVRDLVDRLDPAERDVLLLFYWGDQSTDDIAAWLGVSPVTVRVRLSRARKKLKTLWHLDDEEGMDDGHV